MPADFGMTEPMARLVIRWRHASGFRHDPGRRHPTKRRFAHDDRYGRQTGLSAP
jgi:hypothetical protein